MKRVRLFYKSAIVSGDKLEIASSQFNYLKNVMRLHKGYEFHIFNDKCGEFVATIVECIERRKILVIDIGEKIRSPAPNSRVDLYFSIIKKGPISDIVRQATELGVGSITPIITTNSTAFSPATDRMLSIVVEAAEQCGRITLPEINEPTKINDLYSTLEQEDLLVICDETKSCENNLVHMNELFKNNINCRRVKLLIGPEGGFTEKELSDVNDIANVVKISLGKHILRSETAVVVALSYVNLFFERYNSTDDN